ncbi:hypothetical protein SCB29_33805 [Paraburkholderia sp. SIMBA_055]
MTTCTAPGHPSCTITCSAGCGAIYSEPDGRGTTICANSAEPLKLDGNSRYSIHLNKISRDGLNAIFGGSISDELSKKINEATLVSTTLKDASLLDLVNAIGQQL